MDRITLRERLPEISEIELLIERLQSHARINVECEVTSGTDRLPIYSIVLGSQNPEAPTLLLTGGIHGIERIGSRVVIAYLHTIAELLQWDEQIRAALQQVRLVFIPVINPVGMLRKTRANGNGIDLMRNAPIEALDPPRFGLLAGHRISSLLPWYRGKQGAPMEAESDAVCRVIRREVLGSRFAVGIDVHSGYGMQDRIWFPYSHTRKPFPNLPEVHALKELVDRTLPNHIYTIEPQASQYLVHGDLWDYMYEENREKHPNSLFLPFCLELGSWLWVKKNPRQLLTVSGAFNPELPHRLQRTLRRHLLLFDVVLRAARSYENWLPIPAPERKRQEQIALAAWYRDARLVAHEN